MVEPVYLQSSLHYFKYFLQMEQVRLAYCPSQGF